MANTSILAAFERMWQHVVAALGNKSDTDHTHDDIYYTESEMDSKFSTVATKSDLTSHTSDTTVHITSEERTDWNDAVSKEHTHSNKSILDSTTASYTTDEKTKLSNIAEGAEVNQNAFSNVVAGSTTIAADSEADSFTIAAGTGISVSGDATNDKVTITNSGVRSVSTGSSNGTVSVNTNGTSTDVAVKGLGSAAYVNTDDLISELSVELTQAEYYALVEAGTVDENVTYYITDENDIYASTVLYNDTNVGAELDSLNSNLNDINTSLDDTNTYLYGESVCQKMGTLSESADNIYRNGVYRVSSSYPVNSITDGFLIVFSPFAASVKTSVQFLFNFAGKSKYVRTCWYGTWNSWNSL